MTSSTLHVTPVGTAVYPWLNRADTKFDPNGVYSVSLVLNKVDTKKISDVVKPLMNGGKNNPISPEVDDQGEKTGNYMVKFKLKAKVIPKNGDPWEQAPILLDEDGNRLEKLIGGGSKIKIAYEPYAYEGMGGGVTLRCKKVRIAPDGLVEYVPKSDVDWGEDCVDRPKNATEEAIEILDAGVNEDEEDF
jgi:hypothetical protein